MRLVSSLLSKVNEVKWECRDVREFRVSDLGGAGLEDPRDVGVVEAPEYFGFVAEALQDVITGVGGRFVMKQLFEFHSTEQRLHQTVWKFQLLGNIMATCRASDEQKLEGDRPSNDSVV